MPPQAQATGAIPMVLHAQITGLLSEHELTLVTVAGPEPQECDAAESLRDRGVVVHAVCRTEPRGMKRWQRRWRFASMWLSRRYPFRTIWFWEEGVQKSLDRLLAQERFDMVTVEDNAMGVYRFPTQRPIILTEHEVRRPRPVNWRDWSKGNPIRWVLRENDWQRWLHYQRTVWRRFDRLQVFTPRDAESMCAIAPELQSRVRVNPFGIDLPREADPRREVPGSLIFTGNFTHPPNVDAALWLAREIMPLLRGRCSDVRLTIVGSYIPKTVRALACDDIIVTGPVPEIEPYMERAAVIVAPLRTGGGQRMKVLQGMAMGKAVVTTRRGAEGLTMGIHRPPLLLAADTAQFVNCTVGLLQSDSERHDLGRRARAFVVSHFSPEAYSQRLESIYAELLAVGAAK